jgi:hypothetical protein
VPPADADDRALGGAKDELRRLLDLAEEVQERYELIQRRILAMRAVQLSVFVVTAVALYFSRAAGLTDASWIVPIGFTYLAGIELIIRRRLEQRLRRELRAMQEVVELLRETERSQARGMNALDRAEFRIRLSRFDV